MNNEEITRTLYNMQQAIYTQNDVIKYFTEKLKELEGQEKRIQQLEHAVKNLGWL